MFKEIPLSKFYRLINHGPCVLVTSGTEDKINVAPIAWLTTVNDEPPLLAMPIDEGHFTTELILKTGEFSINIPDENLLPAIIYAGKASGRKENKIAMAGLTVQPGKKVATPYLGEAIGHLECRVKEKLTYDGVIVFIAGVVYAEAKADAFDDCWIPEKAKTVHHLGGKYFALTGRRFTLR